MVFSSLTFLFAFLPLTVVAYHLFRSRSARNLVLLLASLVFYSWGEPVGIFLMIAEISAVWYLVKRMDPLEGKRRSRLLAIVAVIVLGLLFVFKYYNFFVTDVFHVPSLARNITLPIGISFYSFQILSYAIDVYRHEVPAQKSLLNLALYISMFPQLIAGPIVRYTDIESELQDRHENWDGFADGIRRFIVGLGKKVIIANQMAVAADYVFFNSDPASLSSFMCWLGAFAYMLQIYYDFSGYSDMAIGLGQMFGFHFIENFNYPYTATSVTDFWRRWHISLSSWFRDYVYIPLGGSRVSTGRHILNLLIVWTLTGLWHGASWNFVLWGLYYAVLLIIEKYCLGGVLKRLPVLNTIIVDLLVLFGWVLFNSASLSGAQLMIGKMLAGFSGFGRNALNNANLLYLWPYFGMAVIGIFPAAGKMGKQLAAQKGGRQAVDFYLIAVFLYSLMLLVNNTYNPFIYFRF